MSRHVVNAQRERLYGSTLPWFRVSSADAPLLRLTCTRTGCGKSFLLDEAVEHLTAPCPHCCKVSRVRQPGEVADAA